jgi:uncharacterized SAM-binding protein YcdF (DUF218 family)
MNDAEIDRLARIIWDYSQMNHRLEPADAIIAMGSMDLRVAERAAELWNKKLSPIIVASGGFGRLTSSRWTESEAQKFAKVMLAKGVPEQNILVEDRSTNAAENFEFSTEALKEKGIQPKRLIIVTKPYMERRAYATVRKLFPDIEVQLASPEISYENYPTDEIPKDLMINILVGDAQRLMLYPEKGYTIPQDTPKEVEDAMNQLIKLGYDKQLIK